MNLHHMVTVLKLHTPDSSTRNQLSKENLIVIGSIIITESLMKIKPIFRNLSNEQLLRKSLHGGTQNPIESLNRVYVSDCLKTHL